MKFRSGRAFGKVDFARGATYYGRRKAEPVKADCRYKKIGNTNEGRRGKGGENIVLAIGKGTSSKNSRDVQLAKTLSIGSVTDRGGYEWILDSGSSCHLVNNLSVLQIAKA